MVVVEVDVVLLVLVVLDVLLVVVLVVVVLVLVVVGVVVVVEVVDVMLVEVVLVDVNTDVPVPAGGSVAGEVELVCTAHPAAARTRVMMSSVLSMAY